MLTLLVILSSIDSVVATALAVYIVASWRKHNASTAEWQATVDSLLVSIEEYTRTVRHQLKGAVQAKRLLGEFDPADRIHAERGE